MCCGYDHRLDAKFERVLEFARESGHDFEGDAQALERAADVIERRGKPKSFVVAVLCSVLRRQAGKVRADAVR